MPYTGRVSDERTLWLVEMMGGGESPPGPGLGVRRLANGATP